jgi:hypothetical protein
MLANEPFGPMFYENINLDLEDTLLSVECCKFCNNYLEDERALCSVKCLGEKKLSTEVYHLASWVWECSFECSLEGSYCFASCFQSRTGHISRGESTNFLMGCVNSCGFQGVTCVVQCVFPKPEDEVRSLREGNLLASLTDCYEQCKTSDQGCIMKCINSPRIGETIIYEQIFRNILPRTPKLRHEFF